jgi:hypothetical protein
MLTFVRAPRIDPRALSPAAFYVVRPDTIFAEEDGTGAVAANDPVGYLADLSGNGNHLVQATPGNRPLYRTSGGLHWLEFDGTDDFVFDTFSLATSFDRVLAIRPLGTSGVVANGVDAAVATTCRLTLGSNVVTATDVNIVSVAAPTGDDIVTTEQWSFAASDPPQSRLAVDNGDYSLGTGRDFSIPMAGLTLGAATATGTPTLFANMRFSGGIIKASRGVPYAFTDPQIAQLRTYFAALQGRVL